MTLNELVFVVDLLPSIHQVDWDQEVEGPPGPPEGEEISKKTKGAHIPLGFRRFMTTFPSKVRIMPLRALRRLIFQLYSEKVDYDVIAMEAKGRRWAAQRHCCGSLDLRPLSVAFLLLMEAGQLWSHSFQISFTRSTVFIAWLISTSREYNGTGPY